MHVEIKLYGPQREIVGKGTLMMEIEPETTLNDLLNKLHKMHGDSFKDLLDYQSGVLVLRNGEQTRDGKTNLANGDQLSLLPAIAGGSDAGILTGLAKEERRWSLVYG